MELAKRMAIRGGISVSRAAELEKQLTRILSEGLVKEGEIRINGFGVMRIEERSGKAWDPRRRKRVPRRQRKAVKWKPSGELTKRIGDGENSG